MQCKSKAPQRGVSNKCSQVQNITRIGCQGIIFISFCKTLDFAPDQGTRPRSSCSWSKRGAHLHPITGSAAGSDVKEARKQGLHQHKHITTYRAWQATISSDSKRQPKSRWTLKSATSGEDLHGEHSDAIIKASDTFEADIILSNTCVVENFVEVMHEYSMWLIFICNCSHGITIKASHGFREVSRLYAKINRTLYYCSARS